MNLRDFLSRAYDNLSRCRYGGNSDPRANLAWAVKKRAFAGLTAGGRLERPLLCIPKEPVCSLIACCHLEASMKKHHSLPSMSRYWLHRHRSAHGVHSDVQSLHAIDSKIAFVRQQLGKSKVNINGIGLNIQFPYCQMSGFPCACQGEFTKETDFEGIYVDYLQREWSSLLSLLPQGPKISSIHIGAGFPLCFSVKSISQLLSRLFASSEVLISPGGHTLECAPQAVSGEHLGLLSEFGFKKLHILIFCKDYYDGEGHLKEKEVRRLGRLVQAARGLGFSFLQFEYVGEGANEAGGLLVNLMDGLGHLRPDESQFCDNLAQIMRHSCAQIEAVWCHSSFKKPVLGLGVSAITEIGGCLLVNEQEVESYFAAVSKSGFGFSSVPSLLSLSAHEAG